jgi:hypothetical protein
MWWLVGAGVCGGVYVVLGVDVRGGWWVQLRVVPAWWVQVCEFV